MGRLSTTGVEILVQKDLEGRSYSATLVATVEELLAKQGIGLAAVGCLVVVNGPGSFTGVRVGASAAKGFAEGTGIALIAVSRLEVLAWKAGTASAALDAHRHEVFLRIADGNATELLAGAAELNGIPSGGRVAVCEDSAAELIGKTRPDVELVRVMAPTAADALTVAAPEAMAGQFDDVALLDGHYLRRSDAEIFGPASVGKGA